MKKYNNSDNDKLDNSIDRYDDDDDNENYNYDNNNNNKSCFLGKKRTFTRFCLYSKHCDKNYEVSVQLSSLS